MKSVLLGNGINIQFGGKAYSNDFIMKRIIFNARANKYDPLFNGLILGKDIEGIFRAFIDIANKARNGDYDGTGISDDREAIEDFKNRYTAPITKYYDIMLEDWFLLIRLFFITNADIKDQWQSVKQGFERMILDAIYNDGMITNVHQNMNKNVKRFFAGFNHIFSLNYDCNLEALTGRHVLHLHGNYSVLADSENPDIVEGYIRQQAGQLVVIDEFRHCFCNALLDYSGELKFRRASNIKKATEEMDRWLELSKRDEAEYEKQIALLKEKNECAFQFVRTYVQPHALKVGTDYHFDELLKLEGELHIIGLSPNNDSHIFRCINESKLEKIYFYYFPETDKVIPVTKPYELLRVENLWESLDAKKKKYNFRYPIPNNPEVDKFIEVFNALSFDPIPKKKIIDEINSIPQFEANRLFAIVRKKLEEQKNLGNPKSEDELIRDFGEISRIGLREGILPSSLFMLYIMSYKG
ncbi:hypothetical protein LPY66_01020 [Dehalobacter sp. DCM]|uniref:hypothetical protein n=1 Tax=Dehalobacter sp. DCM TaxID=2907827 RepID=UPI003081A8F5|nr:hypothetical protein LPY66_01020 [Dehalobacter sp. DCM]